MLVELIVLLLGLFIGHFSSQWLSLKYPLFSLSNKGFIIMTEMKCKKLWHKLWGTTTHHTKHHHHNHAKHKSNNNKSSNSNGSSDLPTTLMNNLPEMLALFQTFMTSPTTIPSFVDNDNNDNLSDVPSTPYQPILSQPLNEVPHMSPSHQDKVINVQDDLYNILPPAYARKPLRKPSHFLLKEEK